MDLDTEAPAPPALDDAALDRVAQTLSSSGTTAAIDTLCTELRQAGDYNNLFYALLMRKRVELGVSPFPTGPASDLPPETHEAYEEAIRDAGREVGNKYLALGDIPKAWVFFRMLGEPEPVKLALRNYNPGPEEDTYPVVEVAWQHAVFPERGFDLILDRNGVCSAITMVQSSDLSSNPVVRDYCVKRLVHSLYDQLLERLQADTPTTETSAKGTIAEIIASSPELFGEEIYHIDTSHLSAVVQMAMQLPACDEVKLARELCLYGEKLSPMFKGQNDPPFDNTYADYGIYLEIVAGVNVDAGLNHFRAKAEAGMAEGYQFPVEVLVNLLLKVDRLPEALEVAKKHLATEDARQLSCPGVSELARKAGDYAALAETARENNDPVSYLAGLIAAKKS